jgi:general secretion pathway protein I
VLVALVITGLALTAIAGVFADGLRGERRSGAAATALTLAEGQIAAAGTGQPLQPGNQSGDFGGRFQWQLRIAPYEDRQENGTAALDQPSSPLRLYRIEITVAWSEERRQRRLSLATLRLGPAAP